MSKYTKLFKYNPNFKHLKQVHDDKGRVQDDKNYELFYIFFAPSRKLPAAAGRGLKKNNPCTF